MCRWQRSVYTRIWVDVWGKEECLLGCGCMCGWERSVFAMMWVYVWVGELSIYQYVSASNRHGMSEYHCRQTGGRNRDIYTKM